MAPYYENSGQVNDEALNIAGGKTFQVIQLADSEGNVIDPFAGSDINTGLEIPEHDYIALGYTGSDLTSVVYKTGGSGGTTVATLTLAYSDGNLISVTKS
jgi:hypothetical protein